MVDLVDVYMIFFLLFMQVGRVGLGQEVCLVIDVVLDYVILVKVFYVVSVVQFILKMVEIVNEWEKLMFWVKVWFDLVLLEKYIIYVKIGVFGMVYL